jgi:hypothetical protein
MPDAAKLDFEEARALESISERSAAAMLRLCLEKLCRYLLNCSDKSIRLKKLLEDLRPNGLTDALYRMLHACRIVGNDSVHPGEMDPEDAKLIVNHSFDVINEMVDLLIGKPKRQAELWNKIPESKRCEVEQNIGT